MSIEVNNESAEALDEARILRLATWVLDQMYVHPDAELSLVFVDVPAMEQLHVQWMGEQGPTDVLSFPMDELRPGSPDRRTPPGLLGDVVVCPQVAEDQARRAGHSTSDELALLVAHGILHLLGFDHAEPDEAREMFDLQRDLLAGFRRREKAAGRA